MSEHEFRNLRLGQKIEGKDGQRFTVTGIYEADEDRPHRINATKTIEISDPNEWETVAR